MQNTYDAAAETMPPRVDADRSGTWFLGGLKRAFAGLRTWQQALILAGVGILFTLPALWVGFAQDDHFFFLVFDRHPVAEKLGMGILDNFSFSKGDVERNQIRMDMGVLPWWALDDWKVSFWRPLASISHWFEFKVFGPNPLPMHVISIALYGLLCATAFMCYRRLSISVWAGTLAGLLFAVDAAHGIPAGWLSDRNALMSGLFGILTLILHDRWRKGSDPAAASEDVKSWYPHAFPAMGCLALALLSGEAAASTGAYLFAYALFLDPATRRFGVSPGAIGVRVLRSVGILLPYLLVVIAWRIPYSLLGHGVKGSWMYVDPVSDPILYLGGVLLYVPIFLTGLIAAPDGVAWNFIPDSWAAIWSVAAMAFLLVAAWILWPVIKARPAARFWALGALLSVVPCCATIPGDRILMFPSIGAMGLLGLFLAGREDGETWSRTQGLRRRATTVFAVLMIVFNLVLSPIALANASYSIVAMHDFFDRTNASLPADATIKEERYIVLNSPLDMLAASIPIWRAAERQPLPLEWRWLYSGIDDLKVERTGDRTLVVEAENSFMPDALGQIFRDSRRYPIAPGYEVALKGMDATVLTTTGDGRPRSVQFRFAQSLDDPSYRAVRWEHGGYVPFALPAVGDTAKVPGIPPMDIVRVALGETDFASDESASASTRTERALHTAQR